MSLASAQQRPALEKCFLGFEHVNRYWDNTRKTYVAKILPGEFYVTRNSELIATTLGSCVSACIWDANAAIGGMNHFMLPLTNQEIHEVTWGNVASDATRYGNYAMEYLVNEILSHGGVRKNLQAKIFGGGKILQQMSDVGKKNAQFVLQYLNMERIPIVSQDLMGNDPRKVIFQPITGKAMIKKLRSLHNETIANRDIDYQEKIIDKPIEGNIELF